MSEECYTHYNNDVDAVMSFIIRICLQFRHLTVLTVNMLSCPSPCPLSTSSQNPVFIFMKHVYQGQHDVFFELEPSSAIELFSFIGSSLAGCFILDLLGLSSEVFLVSITIFPSSSAIF